MKKFSGFALLGIGVALLFWWISGTLLLEPMERTLRDGFFYLREQDADDLAQGKPNPYVSDQVQLVAIDAPSLGVYGKWPWHRDIHARYLKNVERFSPKAVYFDISFILPEEVPASLTGQLHDQPKQLAMVKRAFTAMDDQFARELNRHGNVYLDLFLVGDQRDNLPYLDRIKHTEKVMERYSLPAPDNAPVFYHSLEPLVEKFITKAQPVTVNAWPDPDEVVRSFLPYHAYRTTNGRNRYYFSAVLALWMRYYGIDDPGAVGIMPGHVILGEARLPVLDHNHQPKVLRNRDFSALRRQIRPGSRPAEYNETLYTFLVNDLRRQETKGFSPVPLYPLHLLQIDDHQFELIDGREVYDAAVDSGADMIDAIMYHTGQIVLRTEEILAPNLQSFPINFAGREENLYIDPVTHRKATHYTIPTVGYREAVEAGELPPLPLLDESGVKTPDYDDAPLLSWFAGFCAQKNDEVLSACKVKHGDLSDDTVRRCLAEDQPPDGRYVFYSMFLDDMVAMAASGGLPNTHSLRKAVSYYPTWLETRDLVQSPDDLLSEARVMEALQQAYRTNFDRFYNKMIFTGAYAPGMAHDIKITPYGSMFGVNVAAQAFNTLVTDNKLTRSSKLFDLIRLFLVCVVMALTYGILDVRLNGYLFLLASLALFAVSYLLFDLRNYLLMTSPLVLANVTVFVAVTVTRVLTEERARKFLKNTFSQYVSPELIETMYRTKTEPQLGGSSDIITAYFTDIQSFSTFSEKLTAHQLVELLNEYLTVMTDTLLAERGTLDKYEGDAIVAFFGAPLPMDDHAFRACKVALAMQAGLAHLREKWRSEKLKEGWNTKGLPPEEWTPGDKWPRIVHEMRMRIGINTGEIVTGNMGSRTRMNYTMMGDAVNLAARLEAGAKHYGVFTLVGETTLAHQFEDHRGNSISVAEHFEVRFIDNIIVAGRSEPVKIYELLCLRGELTEREKRLLELFNAAIERYLRMKWHAAREKFIEAQGFERFPENRITPSLIFAKRCLEFEMRPPVEPGESWDGVYRLENK